ncbi:hypothetical protein [Microbacterium sp. BK668]|uniref:hypothetical protein n=1 Tax=Microbacterium sp. BK668 TaxID=2512118 RepID=UPI00105E981A|nr:hypothetical protein [Microbacterium sp. BK668]TDN90594.1 hypothetical protein EV279_0081 [Microbacterium sp. BK668]
MLDVRINRRASALLAALLAVALVFAPLVTSGAAAAETKGVTGELVEWTSDTNKTSYWEALYADHEAVCYSSSGSTSHGSITDGGKTVTLRQYDPSWPGDHWELLVVKGGNLWNNVVEHPQAGVAYASPENSGGQQSDVSHWIVCKGTTPEVPPTVVTPTLTFSLPTCALAGILTLGDNVTWTSVKNEDGTTTYTASPAAGTVFAEGVTREWTVPSLERLPVYHPSCTPEEEPTEVTPALTYTPATCDAAGTVTRSEGVEWTPTSNEDGSTTWTAAPLAGTVFPEAAQTQWTVPSLAQLSADDEACRGEEEPPGDPDLVPGSILAVCQGDVPYLSYDVTLPEGFSTDDATPLTITFVNPAGDDYVVGDQPLQGSLLWPGASAAEPKMWPGWALVDGTYTETDGNLRWTRAGVTVIFEVNPSYETSVVYPQASALCANPAAIPSVPATPASDSAGPADPADPGTLAVTGSVFQAGYLAAGAIALLAGVAMTVYTARRRRSSDAS